MLYINELSLSYSNTQHIQRKETITETYELVHNKRRGRKRCLQQLVFKI